MTDYIRNADVLHGSSADEPDRFRHDIIFNGHKVGCATSDHALRGNNDVG